MLNDQSEIIIKHFAGGASFDATRPLRFVRPGDREGHTTTTSNRRRRALEVIELFGIHRHPLVSHGNREALAIPQSSSSVLLHSLSSIGFVTRDRKTRKYVPSIRSVFLGNWIHDAIFPDGSLLAALDALASREANVRLGRAKQRLCSLCPCVLAKR